MRTFSGAAPASGAPASITLTPLERPAFAHLFSLADPQKTGIVTGQAAVAFFAGSKLPPAALGQIWAMADSANNGFLTPQQFSVALRLIAHAQRGAELTDKLIQQPGPPPQFEGITLPTPVAGATQRQASISTAPVAGTITAADRARYTRIFAGAGPQNGLLDGEKAKEIFVKSKLPFDKLGAIWNLADTRSRGALDLTDFIIGMHFIQGTMNGSIATIPTVLPLGLYEEASGGASLPFVGAPAPMVAQTTGGSIPRQLTGSGFATPASPLRSGIPGQGVPSYLSPQRTGGVTSPGPMSAQPLTAQHTPGGIGPGAATAAWAVSPAEKAKSDRFFDGLDTEKKGVLEGQAAVPFFMQSGLGEAVLAHVWDLSDITQSGTLSRDEFAVAMHLINLKLSGAELPNEVSPDLIPPSLRGQKLPDAVNPQESDTQKDLFSLMDDDPAPLPVSSASAFVTPAATGSRAAPAPPVARAAVASPFDDDFFNDGPSGAPSAPALSADRSVTSPRPAAVPAPAPNDASAELGNKQLQLDSTTKSLERLQGQKKDLETSVTTGASSVAELESRLSSIKITHEAEERLVRALEERQRAQAVELKTLREETIRGESELSALKAEKDELEQALLRDKEESREMKRKLVQVQTATQQLKDELEKLRKEARQQKGLAAISNKQLSTAEAEQDKVRAEIDNVHNEEAEAPAPAALAVPATGTPSLASPATAAAGVSSPAASVRSLNPFDRFTSQPPQQSPSLSSAALAGGAAVGVGAATAAVTAEHLASPKAAESSEPPAATSTAFDDAFDAPLEPSEVAEASTTALPATDQDDVFDNDFGVDAPAATPAAAVAGPSDNAAFDEAFSGFEEPAGGNAGAAGAEKHDAADETVTSQTVDQSATPVAVANEPKSISADTSAPAAAAIAGAEDPDSSDEEDEGPEDLESAKARRAGAAKTAIPGAFGGSEADADEFEAEPSRFPALQDEQTTADTAAPGTVTESVDSAAPASAAGKSRDFGGPPLTIQNTGTSAGGDAFVDAQNGEFIPSTASTGGPAPSTTEDVSTGAPSVGHERFTTAYEPTTATPEAAGPVALPTETSAARSTSPNKSRRAPPPAPTRAAGNATTSSPASTTTALAAAGVVGAGAAGAAGVASSSQAPREASFDDFDSAFEDLGPATTAPATGASSGPTSGFASTTSSGGALGSSTAFDDAFDGFDFVPSFNNGAPAPSGAAPGAASGATGSTSNNNGASAGSGFDDFDAAFAPLSATSGGPSTGAPNAAAVSATSDGFSFDDAFVTPSGSASAGASAFPTSSTPSQTSAPPLPQRGGTNDAFNAQPPAAPSGALPDDAAPVRQLCAMGFPREKVIEALEKSNYRTERALEKLIAGA